MNGSDENDTVTKTLVKQIRATSNVHYLRQMPLFAVNDDRPGLFDDMLRRLDQAEARAHRDS